MRYDIKQIQNGWIVSSHSDWPPDHPFNFTFYVSRIEQAFDKIAQHQKEIPADA